MSLPSILGATGETSENDPPDFLISSIAAIIENQLASIGLDCDSSAVMLIGKVTSLLASDLASACFHRAQEFGRTKIIQEDVQAVMQQTSAFGFLTHQKEDTDTFGSDSDLDHPNVATPSSDE